MRSDVFPIVFVLVLIINVVTCRTTKKEKDKRYNVAIYQPCKQINTYHSHKCDLAFDGNTNTFAEPNAGYNKPWIYVDLEDIFHVKTIDVTFGDTFRRTSSIGANAWAGTSLKQMKRCGNRYKPHRLTGKALHTTFICKKPIDARYVKISMEFGSGWKAGYNMRSRSSFTEVEVYE